MSTLNEDGVWWAGTGGPSHLSEEERQDHPASRPGTGHPVRWRDAEHRVSASLRCMACGWYKDSVGGGRCHCGAYTWMDISVPVRRETGRPLVQPLPDVARSHVAWPARSGPSLVQDSGFVDGARVPRMIVDDYAGARLNELLGGIKRGALLLVVGAAGAGKSTASAELAAFAANHWSCEATGAGRQPGCKIYWLDSDQKDAALVRECFRTADVESAFEHRVLLLPEHREPYAFDEALGMTPDHARVLVIDSLEKWGRNDTERLFVMDALRAHPAWLKIVIAGTNKLGGVSGVAAIERADDATIYAERTEDAEHTLRFTKRRWQPCASALARGAGQVASALEPAAEVCPPASSPALRVDEGQRPDFRVEATAEAARWPPHELAAYKAQLRTERVPRETIEDWSALVAAAASTGADVPRVEEAELSPLEGHEKSARADAALPASMEAPYVSLLRSWPWTEGVRASAIVEAWQNDGDRFEELFRALQELSGTRDGAIPNATKVGNALRLVRGQSCHGMTLTCEYDRKAKIALWRVIRET